MKFRISGKDLIMFGIFAAMLLYLCAIITGNINTLSVYGHFSGLSPFPGLSTQLPVTLILFVIFLVIIFSGVSSYIFERKSGIGFEISNKDDKGYSRWSKEREMKSDKGVEEVDPLATDSQYAGIPLVNDGKRLWVDNGEYHNLVIGSTGSGKSQTIVEPMVELLIKKGESMIITDPKGELYEGTAKELEKRGYNIILLNFRDPERGNCWNPFTVPYKLYQQGNIDKSIELIEDLAKNILYDEGSKADPFWNNTSADYFAGLAWALFQDAKEEEVNINSINYMATVGEQRIGPTNYMKEYFSGKAPTSTESIKVNSTITAPNETKGSILSVFNQKIQLFSSRDNLSEMLSRSDFDMEDIGRKKTAVFIVVQDEKKTYHPLVTIFLKQCYETLIRVAQEESGGKLKYRTNFLMDEFANMPPLSDVDAMVSAARSRNIRLSFIIQNFSQLNDVYGKEKAETIRGNCSNTIYLLSTELAALEEISKMCGEVKDGDKGASKPLITVTDLQNMKEEEALILRSRMRPFKTKLKYDHKIEWGMSKEKAEYPSREKRPVQLFDLKSFVDAKRESAMNDMLKSLGNRPMPSPMSGNPNMFQERPRESRPNIEDFLKGLDNRTEPKSEPATFSKPAEPKVVETLDLDIKESNNGDLTQEEKDAIRASVKAAMMNMPKPKEEVREEVKPLEPVVESKEEVKPLETVSEPKEEKVLSENELKIKEYEDKRKEREEELQKVIANSKEPETKDTYETSEEARHQITEDEFFDDFFNDEY